MNIMSERELGLKIEKDKLDRINPNRDNTPLASLIVEFSLDIIPDYYSRLYIAIYDEKFWDNYLPQKNTSEVSEIIVNLKRHKDYLMNTIAGKSITISKLIETEIKHLDFLIKRLQIETEKIIIN